MLHVISANLNIYWKSVIRVNLNMYWSWVPIMSADHWSWVPISICIDHECWLPNCCPVSCISQISLTGHSKVFLVKSGLLQVSVQELSRFYCSTVHYLNALFNNAQWPLITCLESDSWNIMHWRTKDNQQKTDALEVYMKRSIPKQLRNHFFKIEFLVKIYSSSP